MNVLENIFASKTQAKLIELFFQSPSVQFYQREIVSKTGDSLGSIQYELKRLEDMNLIFSKKIKRKVYYAINKEFYLYPEIRDIIMKTAQKNL